MAEEELKSYTKINNEILEALAKTELNGRQRRIIDVIIRATYGYQRNRHEISLGYISSYTDIKPPRNISNDLKNLIDRKIVTCYQKAAPNKPQIIGINNQVKEWVSSKPMTLVKTNDSRQNQRYPIVKTNDTPIVKTNDTPIVKNNDHKKKVFKESIKENINKDICANDASKTHHIAPIDNFNVANAFELFWKEYPRKVNKKKAKEKFLKICKTEELFQSMMIGLKQQKNSNEWIKSNGQFIPHPTTWLNGERWNDEINASSIAQEESGQYFPYEDEERYKNVDKSDFISMEDFYGETLSETESDSDFEPLDDYLLCDEEMR